MNWRRTRRITWAYLALLFLVASFVALLPGVMPSKQAAGATASLCLLAATIILIVLNYRPWTQTQSDGSAEAAYLDRNLAVLALARTLHDAGHRVGWRMRDEAWPILTMDLPTGEQVSYHLPADAVWAVPGMPDYPDQWDGHDLAEKQERMRRYCNASSRGDA